MLSLSLYVIATKVDVKFLVFEDVIGMWKFFSFLKCYRVRLAVIIYGNTGPGNRIRGHNLF